MWLSNVGMTQELEESKSHMPDHPHRIREGIPGAQDGVERSSALRGSSGLWSRRSQHPWPMKRPTHQQKWGGLLGDQDDPPFLPSSRWSAARRAGRRRTVLRRWNKCHKGVQRSSEASDDCIFGKRGLV
jgi:hypothetical protein